MARSPLQRCFSSFVYAQIASQHAELWAIATSPLFLFQQFCRRFTAVFGIIVLLHDPIWVEVLQLASRLYTLVYRGHG